ncbi:hypothetical protein BDV06DRAFT_191543 [Aspergillus oleicola]
MRKGRKRTLCLVCSAPVNAILRPHYENHVHHPEIALPHEKSSTTAPNLSCEARSCLVMETTTGVAVVAQTNTLGEGLQDAERYIFQSMGTESRPLASYSSNWISMEWGEFE